MTDTPFLQICVEPRGGTDGPGLASLLRRVRGALTADWAAISDVDLVGRARPSLLTEEHSARVISVSSLLDLLEGADQIVWATIFLCSTQKAAGEITGSEDFVSGLGKADGLVRVVDATYYYVYGPLDRLEGLRGELAGEQKAGIVDDLDFPE